MKKRIINYLIVLICLFCFSLNVYAEGGGEDSGDDSSSDSADYHEMTEDLYDDGNLDSYTNTEIQDAVNEAEDAGDYAYADLLSEYIDVDEYVEEFIDSYQRSVFINDLLDKMNQYITKYDEKTKTYLSNTLPVQITTLVNNIYQGLKIGDPVFVTTGSFYNFENDIVSVHGYDYFSRNYVQNSDEQTSIGFRWTSNFDSRIIRCVDGIDNENFVSVKELHTELKKIYDDATYCYENESVDSYEVESYKEVENQWEIVNATFLELQDKKELENFNHALNSYVLYKGTNESYEKCGNDKFVFIDEYGCPYVFSRDSDSIENEWKTEIKDGKTLSVIDGANSSNATMNDPYFLIIERGFVKKYFNYYGLIIKVVRAGGEVVNYERDDNGKVTRIIDSHNLIYTVRYNSKNCIDRITSPLNEFLSITYSTKDNDLQIIKNVVDLSGDQKQYSYNSDLYLTQIKKPDNKAIQLTLIDSPDTFAKVVAKSLADENGSTEFFSYDFDNKTTKYTDSSGVVTILKYDDSHRVVSKKTGDNPEMSYSYNAAGLLSFVQTGEYCTYFYYDGYGNQIKKSDSNNHVTETSYNKYGQILTEVDADGIALSYEYDSFGNCILQKRNGIKLWSRQFNQATGFLTSYSTMDGCVFFYSYDANNYFKKIQRYSNGAMVNDATIINDIKGRPISIIDAAGRETTFVYDKKTTTIIDGKGLKTVSRFNNRKDLIQKIETDLKTGQKRILDYAYNGNHKLIKISNPNEPNRVIEYQYSKNGKIISEILKDENNSWLRNYSYDNSGRLASAKYSKYTNSVVDNDSYEEKFSYQHNSMYMYVFRTIPLVGQSMSTYSYEGNLVSYQNPNGEKKENVFSNANRLIANSNQFGGWHNYVYDEDGFVSSCGEQDGVAISIEYTKSGRVSKVIDRLGRTTNFFYDPRGNLIKEEQSGSVKNYQYDDVGRITKIFYGNNLSSAERILEYEYNSQQRKIIEKDGGLYQRIFELNAWNEIKSVTDALNNKISYEYNSFGQCITETDAYNNQTKYQYNALNKIAAIIKPCGEKTNYTYNHLGKLVSITDDEGCLWQGSYDKAGRLTSEIKRGSVRKDYSYDSLNRLIETKVAGVVVSKIKYSNSGKSVTFFDSKNKKIETLKDSFGRVISEKNRMLNSQVYNYNPEGEISSIVDFLGNKKIIATESDKRKKTICFSDSNVKNVFTFNMSGQIVCAESETGKILYEYNKAGRLLKVNDVAASEIIKYNYDAAGRRLSMESNDRNIIYEYGKNNELLSIKDKKQQMSVKFEYDANMRQIARIYGNGVKQLTEYDKANRPVLIRELSENGICVRAEAYVYDDSGKRCLTVNEQGLVTRYYYDDFGRLSSVEYPFDKNKQQLDKNELIENGLPVLSSAGMPENNYLAKKDVEKITSLLNKISSNLYSRMPTVQTVWKVSFAYDANGNRISKTTPWGTIEWKYDDENRLISAGQTKFVYDKNGNVLQKKLLQKDIFYSYNLFNRMNKSVVIDSENKIHNTLFYSYDSFGRRTIVSDVKSYTMRTLYDGFSFEAVVEKPVFNNGNFTDSNFDASTLQNDSPITSSSDSSRYRWIADSSENTKSEKYRVDSSAVSEASSTNFTGKRTMLYESGNPVGVNRLPDDYYQEKNSQTLDTFDLSYSDVSNVMSGRAYLGTDVLSSVRSVYDDAGNLESSFQYDAFGKPYGSRDLEVSMMASETIGALYAGKPYENSTGLFNYGYRDYSPTDAGFTTTDPIKYGTNWFSFVENDPVNFVDVLGLYPSFLTEEQGRLYTEFIQSYFDNYVVHEGKNVVSAPLTNDVKSDAIPEKYDCADTALFLFIEAMEYCGYLDAKASITANGKAVGDITTIHSTDFFPNQFQNVTFYEDKSFNNPNISVGSLAVWQGPGYDGKGDWVGHVATIIAIDRDENGNIVTIYTLEGHVNSPIAIEKNNLNEWCSYKGIFLGFAEVERNEEAIHWQSVSNDIYHFLSAEIDAFKSNSKKD